MKSPLLEVTYQLNYPTILDIEANEPVDFQKLIMMNYPNYDSKIEHHNEVMVNVADSKANASINKQHTRKLHIFVSEDQKWRITLAKDMVAVTTTEYHYWEDMVEKVSEVIMALSDVYSPLFFTRVGLRYVDAFDRNELGLQGVAWSELLMPHILGGFSYSVDGNVKVRSSVVSTEMEIDDIIIKLTSGLGSINRNNSMQPSEAFILNGDYFYVNKIERSELEDRANRLHDQSHIFFRNSICDRLHEAMNPERL